MGALFCSRVIINLLLNYFNSFHRFRSLRNPELVITVDHEGGRVQRFKEGFTHIPAMALLGEYYAKDPEQSEKNCLCLWMGLLRANF